MPAGAVWASAWSTACCPSIQLLPRAERFARRLAQGPTLAPTLAKAAIYRSAQLDLANELSLESTHQAILVDSEDSREGRRAFLQKRPPQFKGR